MEKYVDKENGKVVKAIRFTPNTIDKTVKTVASQVSLVTIKYIKAQYIIILHYPFGNQDELVAAEGDYIVESDEIPNTIPKLHYFEKLSSYEFESKFRPL